LGSDRLFYPVSKDANAALKKDKTIIKKKKHHGYTVSSPEIQLALHFHCRKAITEKR
jgi:hypothetical protein